MIELCLVKCPDGAFRPATEHDLELSGSLKNGKGYTVKITQKSDRSYQHHKLFFGGLLALAYDYWQPTGGMIGKSERDTVRWIVRHIAQAAGADEAALLEYAESSLKTLAAARAEKYGTGQSDIEAFREWLVVEAGHFEIVQTPAGRLKRAKSISFANMGQEEFNRFYQRCFTVVWNMVLRGKFENEAAAQEAVLERLALMG